MGIPVVTAKLTLIGFRISAKVMKLETVIHFPSTP